jgi:hypothetical protein
MKEVKISQVDVLFSNGLYPIEFLFYYRKAFDAGRLRSALKKLSAAFWPIFGEYESGRIVYDPYREENFYAEEAADLDLDTRQVGGSGDDRCSRFCLPNLAKLFFLKIVRLKKGMALIPKMSHLAGDGYSYFYFLSVLAALTQPAAVPLKSVLTRLLSRPHHRRTALKDFFFQGVRPKPALQRGHFAVELEEILRQDVRSIIREAASSGQIRISTNDVLSALAIKKIVSKQADSWGEVVRLTIPIDVRRRIKEYGPRFLGNGIMLHTIGLSKGFVDHLTARDIAIKIRKSMPSISTETYIKYLSGLEGNIASGKTENLRPFDPESGVLVTSLSRLPVEKLNFGSGPPDLIIPLTAEKNSAAILARGADFILRYAY